MFDISQLQIGQSATLQGFTSCDKGYRHKLLSMGLTPGVEFTLLRIAPLGDPIEIRVRGARLCLRRNEAQVMRLSTEVITA